LFLSGGYNVTATAVPSPVALTESDPDSTGTRTYTVTPLYGLVFMNPTGDSRPAGAINWYFIPGDSVSSTPGWSEYNEWIQECQFETTCRFRASGPGKVQVNASVERQGVTVRSGGASRPQCQAGVGPLGSARSSVSVSECSQEPKAVLACTGDLGENQVTRGQPIHCEVHKDPASSPGELTITGWSFEGEARTDEPLTGTAWEGPMVRPGTITVKARVGSGAEQTATAMISVAARDWSSKAPTITAHRVPNGDPHTTPALPEAVMWAHHLGHTRFWPDNDETELIDKGPNRDYYYFADVKFSVGAYYSLNDEAFEPISRFTLAQEPNSSASGSVTRVSGMNYCQQRDVPRAAARVETHENEHIRDYREQFTHIVQPEYARLEAMYGKTDSELTSVLDAITKRADTEAFAHSQTVIDDIHGPYIVKFFDSNGRQCMMKNGVGGDLGNEPTTR
jgi:hypothetical protein